MESEKGEGRRFKGVKGEGSRFKGVRGEKGGLGVPEGRGEKVWEFEEKGRREKEV